MLYEDTLKNCTECMDKAWADRLRMVNGTMFRLIKFQVSFANIILRGSSVDPFPLLMSLPPSSPVMIELASGVQVWWEKSRSVSTIISSRNVVMLALEGSKATRGFA